MSFLQTTRPDGSSVSLLREDGQSEAFEVAPAGGTVVHSAPVTLNYHEATSGQLNRQAGVAVVGVAPGDMAWCSPSGPTDTLGVLGGVAACYVVDVDQVDIIGELFSLDALPTTVTQPATVFWVRPDGT